MHKLKQLVRHLRLLPVLFTTWVRIQRLAAPTRLFCFFPYYQTGGSERVHADILESVGSTLSADQIALFFTKKSKTTTFRDHFYARAQCFEIVELDRSKYRRLLLRIIARRINAAESPTVFGANATLLYELIPYLKESTKIIDLTHSFVPASENPVERASLPYVPRLAARVVISQKVREEYRVLYTEKGIHAPEWYQRIQVIHNQLSYPYWDLSRKNYTTPPMKVLFVGRNSPEKRVHLIGRLAYTLRQQPVQFTLVGDGLSNAVQDEHRACVDCRGEITDPETLADMYKEHQVLLITSDREGFPLVLAEGMAHGAVPLTTRVGGIDQHVRHQENGYLVENSPGEEKIIEDMAHWLTYLLHHPDQLALLGKAAQQEAYRSFDPGTFGRKWKELLTP